MGVGQQIEHLHVGVASVVDGTDDKLVDVVGVGIDMCGVGGCIDS